MSIKFLETHFEDYTQQVQNNNLHPYLGKTFNCFPKKMENMPNILLHGPCGIGKYSQMLQSIQKYSPSKLKYEKKMCINTTKGDYFLKISDIHYEVDMALLGCNAKTIMNDIYYQILDSITSKQYKYGILVCKNFHAIHHELLDIFYYYMNNNSHIKFYLISDHISFIPECILNMCKNIVVKTPNKNTIKKIFKVNDVDLDNPNKNLKMLKIQGNKDTMLQSKCYDIIKYISDISTLNFLSLRELIYSLFIEQHNLHDALEIIIFRSLLENDLPDESVAILMKKLHNFLIMYNNNYRPIYHVESILLCLCKLIDENKNH